MNLREPADRGLVALFAVSGLLLALYLNYGTRDFAAAFLDVRRGAEAAVLWNYVAMFALFFVAPVLVWRLGFRRPLREVGLGPGDARYGLKFVAVTVPLLVLPLVFAGSRMPDVRAEYPLSRTADGGPQLLFWLEASYVLYYLGWELFFRGFLILGTRERLGDVGAIGLSTLVTTAIHLGKPAGEVWGAVLVGVVFGWLVIRTRSILWPLVLHALVGILTDVLVTWGARP